MEFSRKYVAVIILMPDCSRWRTSTTVKSRDPNNTDNTQQLKHVVRFRPYLFFPHHITQAIENLSSIERRQGNEVRYREEMETPPSSRRVAYRPLCVFCSAPGGDITMRQAERAIPEPSCEDSLITRE
jgi:hypothetical protein